MVSRNSRDPAPTEAPSLSVAFILLPEFTLLAFTGFIEALRHAADEGDNSRQVHCRWTIIAPSLRPVRASCGVEIAPWQALCDPGRFDYIVVVGGLLRGHARIDPQISAYLKNAAARGVSLVGVCTGSFVLARTGLMRGHRCCIHWFHQRQFEDEFPGIQANSDELFVDDHGRITCAGGVGVIDLAVHLVERHCGRARALKSLRQMVVERAREARAPQPRIGASPQAECPDPLVRRAIRLMEQHLADPPRIAEIARNLGTTGRRLERAFVSNLNLTPARFCRDLRLQHGRWLLANTRRKITEIACECGFADASHFARCYRQTFKGSPADYRRSAIGQQ